MSQSFMVECPSCHARGELSDPTLIGKAISCPACQFVFTLANPAATSQPIPPAESTNAGQATIVAPPAAEPAVPASAPVPAVTMAEPGAAPAAAVLAAPAQEILQPVPAPVMPPVASPPVPVAVAQVAVPWPAGDVANTVYASSTPTPAPAPEQQVGSSFGDFSVQAPPVEVASFNFGGTSLPAGAMASPHLPGPAEELFAQGLPQPAARGSVKPKKAQSKQTTMLVGGGVAAVVLFVIFMFLAGDPFRNASKKHDEVVAAEKERMTAKKKMQRRTASDPSLDETLKKIQAMSSPNAAPSAAPSK